MTTEKFLETLKLIRDLDEEHKFQASLDLVSTTLTNLTNTPADTNAQSTLATSLDSLEKANAFVFASLAPSDLRAIASMGAEEYFANDLAANVKASVASNAMTPSVARDFVKRLATQRASFMKTAIETITGLEKLGVSGYELDLGGSDLSFVIPRDLFSNELSKFSTELRFLDKLLQDLSEATLGKPQFAELQALSTTTPIVSVLTDPHVLNALAKAVQFFLDAWKKIEEIRKVRADVVKVGVVGAALDQFNEKIEETVTEVVEETVRFSLASYPQNDEPRKNELRNALSQDYRRLFGQIEQGLVVEFRARPEEVSGNGNADPLIEVRDIAATLDYPAAEPQPLLLSSGELLEGEIVRTVKEP